MIRHRKVDIKTETELELLRADNAELKQRIEDAETMTDGIILLIADLIGGNEI